MWGSEERSDCEGEKKGRSDSYGNLRFALQKVEYRLRVFQSQALRVFHSLAQKVEYWLRVFQSLAQSSC